ncbi:unnamed protein product [Ilex paraguariensis]|uniref:Uncharacterized protein n=1 Tax=Ilex paraguariensis TaxID=185542 RepID=A0ABC8UQI9_9AQUA
MLVKVVNVFWEYQSDVLLRVSRQLGQGRLFIVYTVLGRRRRKAVTPPAVGTTEVPPGGVLKKKPKAEWSCAFCQRILASQPNLLKLLVSEMEEASLPKILATENENDAQMLPVIQDLGDPKKNGEGAQIMQKTWDYKKKRYRFLCEMCQIGAHSEKLIETHKKGKKHVTRLKEVNKHGQVDSTIHMVEVTQKENDAEEAASNGDKEVTETVYAAVECSSGQFSKMLAAAEDGIDLFPKKTGKPTTLVKITDNPSSEQGFKVEGEGPQDTKMEDASLQKTLVAEKKNDASLLSVDQDTDDPKKKNWEGVQIMQKTWNARKKRYRFLCELCQIGAHSEKVIETHKKGKKHVAQLQKLYKIGGANSTIQMVESTQKENDTEGAANDGDKEGVTGDNEQASAEVDISRSPKNTGEHSKFFEGTGNLSSERGVKIKRKTPQFTKMEAASLQKTFFAGKKNDARILPVSQDTDNPKKKNGERFQIMQKTTWDYKKTMFRCLCEMCQIGSHSENVMETHMKGKKHVARLKRFYENSEAYSTLQMVEAPQKENDSKEASHDVDKEISKTVYEAAGCNR